MGILSHTTFCRLHCILRYCWNSVRLVQNGFFFLTCISIHWLFFFRNLCMVIILKTFCVIPPVSAQHGQDESWFLFAVENSLSKQNCQPHRMGNLQLQNSIHTAQLSPKLDRDFPVYFSILFLCDRSHVNDWFYLHSRRDLPSVGIWRNVVNSCNRNHSDGHKTKRIPEVKEPNNRIYLPWPFRVGLVARVQSKKQKRKACSRWIENDLRARFCCFELSHLQLTKILRKCERVYIRNDRTIIIVINMIM